MKKIFVLLFILSMLFVNMSYAEKTIGMIRTFDRYKGNWTITDIIKDKAIKTFLRLDKTKCPHCGEFVYSPEWYISNYTEILEYENKKIHLFVSTKDRWIILEDYLSKPEIEILMKEYV